MQLGACAHVFIGEGVGSGWHLQQQGLKRERTDNKTVSETRRWMQSNHSPMSEDSLS